MAKPIRVDKISKKVDKLFKPSILFLHKYKVTANHITLLQLPFVILFFYFLAIDFSRYLAFFFLGISLVLDLADGAFARITHTASKKGFFMIKYLM